MRIVDMSTDRSVNNIFILLTASEAKEMLDKLKALLVKPDSNHAHISSDDYQKEITISIYSNERKESFSQRLQQLIQKDE